jgi:hypothetical protein
MWVGNPIILTMIKLRVLAQVAIISLVVAVAPSAHADVPPSASTSCSLTDAGARFSASIVFSGGSWTLTGINYDWQYALLNPGQNPSQTSSYGPRTLAKSTVANGVDFTYEELLALANGNASASILFVSIPKLIMGTTTVTNSAIGQGCYVGLSEVLANKNSVAAAKAAAAAAPQSQPTPSSNALVDALFMKGLLDDISAKQNNIKAMVLKFSGVSSTVSANLNKMLLGMPQLPKKEGSLTLDEIQSTYDDLLKFSDNINIFRDKLIASEQKAKVVCAKGKTVKTVSGTKCPAGYKVVK